MAAVTVVITTKTPAIFLFILSFSYAIGMSMTTKCPRQEPKLAWLAARDSPRELSVCCGLIPNLGLEQTGTQPVSWGRPTWHARYAFRPAVSSLRSRHAPEWRCCFPPFSALNG